MQADKTTAIAGAAEQYKLRFVAPQSPMREIVRTTVHFNGCWAAAQDDHHLTDTRSVFRVRTVDGDH